MPLNFRACDGLGVRSRALLSRVNRGSEVFLRVSSSPWLASAWILIGHCFAQSSFLGRESFAGISWSYIVGCFKVWCHQASLVLSLTTPPWGPSSNGPMMGLQSELSAGYMTLKFCETKGLLLTSCDRFYLLWRFTKGVNHIYSNNEFGTKSLPKERRARSSFSLPLKEETKWVE